MPDLMPGSVQLLLGFWELTTDRQIGFGAVGPIPSLAISWWMDREGIDDDEDRKLCRLCLRAMDDVYMTHVNKAAGRSTGGQQGRSTLDDELEKSKRLPPMTPAIFDSMFKDTHKRAR